MNSFLEALEGRLFYSSTTKSNVVTIDGQTFHSGACGCSGCNALRATKLQVMSVTSTKKTSSKSTSSTTASTAAATASQSGFQITLNLSGTVSAAVQAAFTEAVNKWQTYITGDLPDVSGIDDVQIDATIESIDGEGNVLGQSGPTAVRKGSGIPTKGIMQFDSADLESLAAAGQLDEVVFHEMGHVLGIGTIWSSKGLLKGVNTSNPTFTGANALAAYKALGGTGTGVPVESSGGSGTAFGHWSESVFDNEIMTGYLDSGTNPTSTITLASLVDLGYTGVQVSLADSYTIPGVTPPTTTTDPSTPTTDPTTSTATGSITGLIFLDLNRNRRIDRWDAAAEGATVYLDLNNNKTLDTGEPSATTDSSGRYTLSSLESGRYILRLVVPTGYAATTPTGYSVPVSSENGSTTVNFGLTYRARRRDGGVFGATPIFG